MNSSGLQLNGSIDRCSLSTVKEITEQFENNEYVLLSTLITKVNQNNKKQERIFLITNIYIYNIVPKSERKLSFLAKSIKIKRKIKLKSIYAISITNIGAEFVIHVPIDDFRKKILETLIIAYQNECDKKLGFYFRDDFTLIQVCTTENDVKKGINRLPVDKLIEIDVNEFQDYLNKQQQDQLIFKRPQLQKLNSNTVSIDDFDLIKVLGRGAFGKVMMCQKKNTNQLYAVKSIRKEQILEKNQVAHTKAERKLLEEIDHPFLISLDYAFQTQEKIYFVMKFMRGGDLFKHLKEKKKLNEEAVKFYAASVLLALEYLHQKSVVYRDLKPENILLDEQGYIKVSDYGLAKFLDQNQQTYSFLGTPSYLAPEIIKQGGYSFDADLWSFGILIYELFFGRPPFVCNNQNLLFRAIIQQDITFPNSISISSQAKDLIQKLLIKNPNERLGHNKEIYKIKQHPWFRNFQFYDLFEKKLTPPIIPKLQSETDVSNFDEEFTKQEIMDSLVNIDKGLCQQFKEEFGGVTYMPDKII